MMTFAADLAYAWADPRVRLQKTMSRLLQDALGSGDDLKS